MPILDHVGEVMRLQGSRRSRYLEGEEQLVWQGKNSEFMVFDFQQLLQATNNFSEENKLGQGGFGVVYKVNYYVFFYMFISNFFSFLT